MAKSKQKKCRSDRLYETKGKKWQEKQRQEQERAATNKRRILEIFEAMKQDNA